MLNSYSASKKKGSYRRSDFDAVISNSRILSQNQQPVQAKNPYLEKKWSTMNRRPIQNTSYKTTNQEREIQREKEKENVNSVQSRLDRYNCPGQSPISQPYVSPMKQSYDPKARRQIQTGRQNNKQINYQQSESKYSYKIGQPKDNTYNYNAKKYCEYKKNVPPLTSRSTILYDNQSRDEMEKEEPYTPRQSYQKNPNLTITFSTSNNITPKKGHVQLPDQLIEKCQFLKQRMERINRMTPKGISMRERQRQKEQITPEKYHPKTQREPIQQSTSTTIVRYNKYCDQKLPLQTIYDAQQHRPEHRDRQTVEQAQQGLQQISSLSKKISERLKQIINRHSN